MIRVLYVDDEKAEYLLAKNNVRRITKQIDLKYTPDVASALSRIRDEQFDCIVCDYSLVGRDGLHLLSDVRAMDDDIPFIFLTGHGSERVASVAMNLGASDYFTKNIDLSHYHRLCDSIQNEVDKHKHAKIREEELSQLTMSEQKYRQLFELSPVCNLLVRRDGIIEAASDELLSKLNYTRKEFLGRELANFLADPVQLDQLLKSSSSSSGCSKGKLNLICKDRPNLESIYDAKALKMNPRGQLLVYLVLQAHN